MLFSLPWLTDYVELPDEVREVAERLTFAGLAVEGIEEGPGGPVLDVDVTTNRPDCMNHLGLAREAALLFGRPLRRPAAAAPEAGPAATEVVRVSVDVAAREACPRYVAKVVRGVRVAPSPEWLQERLRAVGLRPVNNLVDITNYVLWESGQPLHAFDLGTLEGPRIEVRWARQGEVLVTLDGERRELGPEHLVIADGGRAVALAGVMGGEATEVSERTTDVLIESAHFQPSSVRRGARSLGLHTDASHRFERGTDPEACRDAAERAAALMHELAGGTVLADAVDERAIGADAWRLEGSLERRRLVAFAGVDVPAPEIERILAGLGFELDGGEKGERWRVRVPSWRFYDFKDRRPDGEVWEADLFEEVLRVFGFDRVPAALPALGAPDAGRGGAYRQRSRVAHRLAGWGFAEAINWAFQDEAADARFPAVERRGPPLRIANPLSERHTVLRRSLLPNLVASAERNLRRGAERVRLFEIGGVFPGGDGPERETVALVMGGRSGPAWQRTHEPDLFDLKGVLEGLAAEAGTALEARAAELPGLVEGTAAELRRDGGAMVGYFGEVDGVEAPFPLLAGELDLEVLEGASAARSVRPPSRFPAVATDLTLRHALSVRWQELAAAIEALEVEDLVAFELKDRYRGEGVPEGAVATTIGFVFNSEARSLTQEEVNERHQALARELERRFGWKA